MPRLYPVFTELYRLYDKPFARILYLVCNSYEYSIIYLCIFGGIHDVTLLTEAVVRMSRTPAEHPGELERFQRCVQLRLSEQGPLDLFFFGSALLCVFPVVPVHV